MIQSIVLVFGLLTLAIAQCPPLSIPSGTAVGCGSASQSTGTVCPLTCINGNWINGIDHAICQSDGTWNILGTCGQCPQHWWSYTPIYAPKNLGPIGDWYYPDWAIYATLNYTTLDQDMGVVSSRECGGSSMGGFLIDRTVGTLGIYLDNTYSGYPGTVGAGWFTHGGVWAINTIATVVVSYRNSTLTLTLNGVDVLVPTVTVTPNPTYNWSVGIQDTCNPMTGSLNYLNFVSCPTRCQPDNTGPVNGNGGTCNSFQRVLFPCNVTCNQGYILTAGNPTRTCQGSYSYSTIDPTLTCTPIVCTNPTLPANAFISSGCLGSDAFGSTCTLGCNPGYYASSGSSSYTCNANGNYPWNLVCLPITCSNGALPSNTQISTGCTGSDAFGATCTLGCSTGFYQTSGSTSYTCNLVAPGSYSFNLGCSAITCSTPALPPHTHIVSGCTALDAYNANCVLACDTNYIPVLGTATTTCLTPGAYSLSFGCSTFLGCWTDTATRDLNGTFEQGQNPMSVEICAQFCGSANYFAVQDGGECYCGSGYGKYGPSIACTQACNGVPTETCGGAWGNDVYTGARAITCSTPTLPLHTQVVSGCTNGDIFGSSCNLACVTGFYQTGGNTVKSCTGAIVYSLDLVCTAITCAETNTLPVGAGVVSGCTSADAYNSTCVLQCLNGFTYSGGSFSRTCNLAATGSYAPSNLNCTAFTPKNITGTYTNGWTVTSLGVQFLAVSSNGVTTYLGSFTNDSTHVEVYVNGTTYPGIVNINATTGAIIGITLTAPTLGTWVLGAPVPQPYTYPTTLTFLPDGAMCFAPGFTQVLPWNFCTAPGTCMYRRNTNIWAGERGVCLSPCNATQCPSKTGVGLRGSDKYCNATGGGSFTCVNYQPLGAKCGGYDANSAPQAPYCNWQSVCLTNGTSWTCQNSSCLSTCNYGTYCYTSTTTSDTAICGGYEVPAFNTLQFSQFLAIYVGYEPGDPLQSVHSHKRLMSVQTGADLIGQLPCTPNTNDCGLSAVCLLDPSTGLNFCASPGLYQGGVPTA